MQLGPTSAMSDSRAVARNSPSSFTPSSSPVSEKPEVKKPIALDAVGDAILENARRDLAGHRADGVVDWLGHLGQALAVGHAHRLDAGNFVGIDLHRVELAREAGHRAQPQVTAHPLVADDRDRTRVEGAAQIFDSLCVARIAG